MAKGTEHVREGGVLTGEGYAAKRLGGQPCRSGLQLGLGTGLAYDREDLASGVKGRMGGKGATLKQLLVKCWSVGGALSARIWHIHTLFSL